MTTSTSWIPFSNECSVDNDNLLVNGSIDKQSPFPQTHEFHGPQGLSYESNGATKAQPDSFAINVMEGPLLRETPMHIKSEPVRDLFEVSELKAQLSAAQTGDRLANHVWSCCADSWLQPLDSSDPLPIEIQVASEKILNALHQENDTATLTQRGLYGLETKNRLVNRLHEEVDLFMMSPECTPALRHLDALKEQLAFQYHRITQHVVSFADARLRTIPVGAPPVQALCISTWAQCVGYELLCELLDSLVKEVEMLRCDCIHSSEVITSYGDSISTERDARGAMPSPLHRANSQDGSHSWSSDFFQEPSSESPRESSANMEDIHQRDVRPKRVAGDMNRSRSGSMGSQDSETESMNRKKSRYGSALPQGARAYLDQWLSSHWHDPYPTPDEKAELAFHCNITVDQVNHWFINARVRRWRPTMEKAANRAKTSGNTAFAALVKDCGEENPFAKFLSPITVNRSQARGVYGTASQAQGSFNPRLERHV